MDMKLSPLPIYEYSGDPASDHISLSAGLFTDSANFRSDKDVDCPYSNVLRISRTTLELS